ncbi:MAG: thymidylate kinase [Alphaproteobacteria bacterium]|jgi:dTMP kinase|nr:thymidylate kinase [Alphaproteobacteria bacterium]MBU1549653.1 thymidylate kinase [Alphaproteobacteria bacterium]MBU2336508.1 thymidylate kinase [Alphaproteobacteria bacterium]MBU2387611.1 thymidylate kinase [Alphaproteobacteria bacterium]
MAGKLFIFEGPDGVGKSTIVQGLREKLPSDAFTFLSFPGKEEGTLGQAIYRIHHEPKNFGIAGMSELARQALHIAAHIDVIETRIRPWIAEGKYVVLDRFWWSTIVYGLVGGGNVGALEALVAAEETVWGDIIPAIAFLIDRDRPINRQEEPSYWQDLRKSYAQLATSERGKYNVEIIRNTGSISDGVEHASAGIQSAL